MRVLIVGGGFGGVKAALELANDSSIKITLISDKDHFLYYPALYSTATGHSHLESWVPLTTIFTGKTNVKLVKDSIESIEIERKILRGSSKMQYEYDNLVLALGVVTTYFGIEGLAENSYSIKSADEITRFKKHLHAELVETGHMDKNYVVVGAGPTGVELAAALTTYLARISTSHNIKHAKIHVDLVEAASRILPKMSEVASRRVSKRLKLLGVRLQTNKVVQSEDDDSLMVSGRSMPTQSVIWTSGVANNPFFKANEQSFHLAPNGRVIVDDHMQAAKSVFVIGDNAFTPYSGLAQTALHDAIYIARHLKNIKYKKFLPLYKAVKPPVVVPVGENWAVFEWGPIRITGWIASLIRRASDFIGYSDVLPIGQALGIWRAQSVIEEDCPVCARPAD